jgi:hypothetical protein
VGPGDGGPEACTGDPGEFWGNENFELMLDIHEFLLEDDFESAFGDVGTLSELPRPSNVGRFDGVFAAGGMLIDCGGERRCCPF